ncbi:hypothetical protein ACFOMD_05880 [Sphingoaurantiacus capsulatus]|uniref:LytR/CpsA/Psr regulator C-terminal domain-containing protein n=1 Tax=Sphingoaurantiacus capsulatus TaxID=1771310 RepID=A0ABV7XA26_9SPHN
METPPSIAPDRDPFAVDANAPVLGERANPTQAREWILDCLARAGGSEALIAPGALSALAYAADGSGSRLRQLASAAWRHAREAGASRIEMGHARRAIAAGEAEAAPLVLGPAVGMGPAVAPVVVMPEADEPVVAAPAPEPEPVAEIAAPPVIAVAEPVDDIPPPPVVISEPVRVAPAEPLSPPRRSRWGVLMLAGASAAAGAVAVFMLRPAPTNETVFVEPEPVVALSEAPMRAPTPAAEALPEDVVADAPVAVVSEPMVEPLAPPLVVVAERPKPVAREVAVTPKPKPAAPQIVLRYASDQPGAAEAASRVAALLRARGHDVSAVRGASNRVRQASVRYADGDQAAAESVNDAFETLLRAYQPNVASLAIAGDAAPGTIELWLPDSAATAARPLRTDGPPV